MKPNVVIRKLHYWSSVAVALPILLVIATGLLLQVKKHLPWVQPAEQLGSVTAPAVDLDDVLAAAISAGLGVRDWNDIQRIDIRPGKGLAKVSLRDGWELQIDLGTGRVLQSAYRRSDVIESIHDGSFFAGNWSKLGVFLPSGLVLLFLWASGLWLFVVPIAARRRKASAIFSRSVVTDSPCPRTTTANASTYVARRR